MRLRRKHLDRALSTRNLSPRAVIRDLPNPEAALRYFEAQLRLRGYSFADKRGPANWKAARMTTTTKRRILRGRNFAKKTTIEKAATMGHELVHARQYQNERAFLSRYVFDARFRLAMEAQAYREQARIYRALGYSSSAIHDWAFRLPAMLCRSYYFVGRRFRRDIARHVPAIVLKR